MTDQVDAEAIAARLTERQQRALLKIIHCGNDPYGRPWTMFAETKRVADQLVDKNLLISGRVYGGFLGYRFEPRALAVRDVLMKEKG